MIIPNINGKIQNSWQFQTTNQPTIRILTPHAHGGASTQLGPSAGALGSSAGCPRATQHPGPCTSGDQRRLPRMISAWNRKPLYYMYICISMYIYIYIEPVSIRLLKLCNIVQDWHINCKRKRTTKAKKT